MLYRSVGYVVRGDRAVARLSPAGQQNAYALLSLMYVISLLYFVVLQEYDSLVCFSERSVLAEFLEGGTSSLSSGGVPPFIVIISGK